MDGSYFLSEIAARGPRYFSEDPDVDVSVRRDDWSKCWTVAVTLYNDDRVVSQKVFNIGFSDVRAKTRTETRELLRRRIEETGITTVAKEVRTYLKLPLSKRDKYLMSLPDDIQYQVIRTIDG